MGRAYSHHLRKKVSARRCAIRRDKPALFSPQVAPPATGKVIPAGPVRPILEVPPMGEKGPFGLFFPLVFLSLTQSQEQMTRSYSRITSLTRRSTPKWSATRCRPAPHLPASSLVGEERREGVGETIDRSQRCEDALGAVGDRLGEAGMVGGHDRFAEPMISEHGQREDLEAGRHGARAPCPRSRGCRGHRPPSEAWRSPHPETRGNCHDGRAASRLGTPARRPARRTPYRLRPIASSGTFG